METSSVQYTRLVGWITHVVSLSRSFNIVVEAFLEDRLLGDIEKRSHLSGFDCWSWRDMGSTMLVQELLCFVDLCRQVRATASIGMVEEHESSVGLADLVLGQRSLAGKGIVSMLAANHGVVLGQVTYLRERISVASFLVIFGSKPPL